MNPGVVCVVIVLAIAAAGFALAMWCSPRGDAPKVKTHDAIDEEIRRERLELHNTSLAYSVLQRSQCRLIVAHPVPLDDAANAVEVMVSAAFREGAKWQQRRP